MSSVIAYTVAWPRTSAKYVGGSPSIVTASQLPFTSPGKCHRGVPLPRMEDSTQKVLDIGSLEVYKANTTRLEKECNCVARPDRMPTAKEF